MKHAVQEIVDVYKSSELVFVPASQNDSQDAYMASMVDSLTVREPAKAADYSLNLGPKTGNTPHVSANTAKLFPKGVPTNPNIVDLVVRMDAAKGTKRTYLSIARELFGESPGNDSQSKSHLSQICRMRRNGRITL